MQPFKHDHKAAIPDQPGLLAPDTIGMNFYRADPARSAGKMGLGLSICKALVTAQHGSISARSPGKGGGTCITLAFAPIPPAVDE